MKSACVSVVTSSCRGGTKSYYGSARIPGQPTNPNCSVLSVSNTQMIANVSQSCSSLSQNRTHINQSGFPDETHLLNTKTQTLGAQHSMNLTNNLQTYADLASNKQLESYRRLVSKPERPPRAIDKITNAQTLSDQNSINLVNNLQTCADLASNQQLESYRRIVPKPGAPTQGPSMNNQPKGRGAFAVAPQPDAPDFYEDCHYESMVYSRAYQAVDIHSNPSDFEL